MTGKRHCNSGEILAEQRCPMPLMVWVVFRESELGSPKPTKSNPESIFYLLYE
jgi:hypothetical protein